ncbi:MAG TPA: PCYCGC motif-containing (lipo)protein [Gemmatimonadales bacterium]|nr:PCYCGC motif-containing (lipo)protein [Gemmatimonadales bacterium]
MPSRRRFLVICSVGLVPLLPGARQLRAARPVPAAGPHPTPRPGITAARVLSREQLADTPAAIPVFDQVREIPEIVDGIRCQCGCADLEDHYSLLSCYEGEAMAKSCVVCQGQGRLAYRLHRAGKTLEEIRHAIDARYG